ncbi:MAG: 5-methyltetrahydropteroyltriglutamate--homocysteine S-methyltransferase, partial [Lachnospiraceae bacterium]|nr:5-methyltetrahydropteroyltriglutamate--homocysteine S-methyltransferase [Lachnospiraceae bacterium]
MKTSIVGFPRVGKFRELKFASEKYFKGEISAEELEGVAKELRSCHWKVQKDSGLDFISSNDFSFYDNMLDTAVLLNVIPKRYKDLNLSPIDTYFAMARGYQGNNGDVKALAMKKWFNTNYHYMVPEIDDSTVISLKGSKIFDEYKEAKASGIETKPVIIGAFTFLKLARFVGEQGVENYTDQIISAYQEILKTFSQLGTKWVQFDEPYLVHDITSEDILLFNQIYQNILTAKGEVKVLLQTYFGDIRDCYGEVISLDFDGIGLDFVEGKESLEIVGENGFPDDKIIFAGVVNGKNIWRNQYTKTVNTIKDLQKNCKNIVIGTSCSLLHVPYTLKSETKLSDIYKKYFAFAEEKLSELNELKEILCSSYPE